MPKITAHVPLSHPNGQRTRAGHTFFTEPREYDVTPAELKELRADAAIIITTPAKRGASKVPAADAVAPAGDLEAPNPTNGPSEVSKATGTPKPLARMNKDELTAEAARLGVVALPDASNANIRQAIQLAKDPVSRTAQGETAKQRQVKDADK